MDLIDESLADVVVFVQEQIGSLLKQYRDRMAEGNHRVATGMLKQAIDAPRKSRAALTLWIEQYDAENGAGAAEAALADNARMSRRTLMTMVEFDAALAEIDARTVPLADRIKALDEIAAELEPIAVAVTKRVPFRTLPLPQDFE